MAWDRSALVRAGEQVLVESSHVFNNGTRFDLLVTDSKIAYSRRKTFAVSDPIETIVVPRSDVSHVVLGKASPWGLWILGAFLIGIFGLYMAAVVTGQTDTFHFHTLLILGLGGACFMSGRHRWRLRWRAGGKEHFIKQPVSSIRVVRDDMADGIQRAGALLNDGALKRQ